MSRMRRLLALMAVILGVGCSSQAPGPIASSAREASAVPTAAVTASDSCPADDPLGPHTYHRDRLLVLAACVSVSGVLEAVRPEPDGDDHVLVRLDAQYGYMLNAVNTSAQRGDLVVEPECMHPVTQSDAIFSCSGYQNPLVLPKVGSRVRVVGPWVTDKDHGWNEIHPAYVIEPV